MIRTLLATAALAAAPMALMAQDTSGSDADAAGVTEGFTMIARAPVMDTEGTEIGTVSINDTQSGTMLIVIALTDIPEGAHGVHIHETGDCGADDFSSAGGHLAGDRDHGVFSGNGPHPGDLPNVIVASDGSVNVEYFNDLLTKELLFDDDGSAFIVHAGPDDYMSQPAGDAGDRIACGVFEDLRDQI